MKPKLKKLKNQATIIGIPAPRAKSLAIAFGFRTGSRSEKSQEAGISHFLEHMLFKGSQKRPSAKAIAVEVDKIGANYNAFTGKEYTYYFIETTPQNFDLALDVLGDMVTRPLLDAKELKKERGTILEEIKMYEDNPMINLFGKMEETIFGKKSGLGREIAGNKDTVQNIDEKVMKKYFQNFYSASNAVAVLAGNLPKDYLAKVSRYLLRLPQKAKTNWESATLGSQRLEIIHKKTEQAHFGINFPGFCFSDPRRYTADVLATILGGYMSSRLFTEIRERRGWAYRIGAFHDSFSDIGTLAIYGGLKLEKIFEAVKIIKKEVFDICHTLTDEEISRAKSHLEGSTILKFEAPYALATQIGLYFLLEGKTETPEEYVKKIKSITRQDLIKVAKEIFQEQKMYLTVIGPFSNKKDFAKIII